jgi:ABC-type spermidine/putrescine transport system permease subunit I
MFDYPLLDTMVKIGGRAYFQVFLRNVIIPLQQMDVLAAILWLFIPSFRDILSYDCPVLLGGCDEGCLGETVQTG